MDGLDDAQLQRYARHILLDEVGVEGQERLAASHVLIVGAGGLGSPVALYLAASGVGHISLADDDTVDLTNLQRQILHTEASVGQAKVESAVQTLAALNPHVRVRPLAQRVDAAALDALLTPEARADGPDAWPPITLLIDASDNMATRQALNAAAVRHGVALVAGAALGLDGQMFIRDPAQSGAPCYACVFPPGQAYIEQRCATYGVLAPLVGWVGSLQALAALQILLGWPCPAAGALHLFDARSLSHQRMDVPADPHCPVCGGRSLP
ncbi:HesA/MoeB/ThiF family protein [Amphibiibacter pelophylacis]|uniref:HesA/MoeB/ThiF family protein n=1 Tax=Amphibiibacter pelophylacis TaxID=1799477 RepID=A0ACC6P0S0_9BURK